MCAVLSAPPQPALDAHLPNSSVSRSRRMLDGQSAAHLSCKPLVSCWEEMLAHVWPRLKGYPSVQIPFSGWFEPLTCQNDLRPKSLLCTISRFGREGSTPPSC